MDRIDAMAVFAATVDEGSLSGAGRKLGMPLATVSRKLAELEAHLGVSLLARTTRQLSLTDAGQDYLAACREILERVDEAERAAAGEHASPRGELVVAAPLVFGRLHVLPVVQSFLATYPDVDVRLSLSDRNANLFEEHIDVAVRIGTLPDSGLVAKPVGQITRVTCASPSYLKRFGTPRQPADLRLHHCITFESLMSAAAWSFTDAGGHTERVPVRSRLKVNTADAAAAAAVADVGVTRLLSYQVAEPMRRGELVRLLPGHEPAPAPVSLLYMRQGRLPMKTRCFVDMAGAQLQVGLSLASSGAKRRRG